MARKSKPWFWSARKVWATSIEGVRIKAPPEVVTEHDAWSWHAALLESKANDKPIAQRNMTVQVLFELYAKWDLSESAAGSRNAETARGGVSAIRTIVSTRIGTKPFGLMRVSTLNREHYDALVAAWRKTYKPNSVAALAGKLKTIFGWAAKPTVDRGPLVDVSPFRGCKTPPVPASVERYGDRAMAARWLRFLWREPSGRLKRDALFQRCLIHTGARPSELVWATWGDVRWNAMKDGAGNPMAIIARADWKNSRKTGRTRRVFLPARLVRMMRRLNEGKAPGDLIFPTVRGKRYTSAGISGRTYYLKIKAAEHGLLFAEHGGTEVTNYLWRHVAASDLLMSGVDVATVAELLGTSAGQIQRTYGHLLSDHLARASEKLGRRR